MITRPIGFSTGSLSPGNTRLALSMLAGHITTAIELSALRAGELDDVIEVAQSSDLTSFRYISVHAPSKFEGITELETAEKLQPIIKRGWPVILHPDAISDWDTWQSLGSLVTIENMDGRKPVGRTVEELQPLFDRLPDASFCFDIGHAAQIDPTMKLATELLAAFRQRLIEVHMSAVDTEFIHQQLSVENMKAFGPVLRQLPDKVAIILETPVNAQSIQEQMRLACSHP